jgi:hypothetical protein
MCCGASWDFSKRTHHPLRPQRTRDTLKTDSLDLTNMNAMAAALQAIADALASQTEAQRGFAKLQTKPRKTAAQYLRERKTRGMGKTLIRPSYQNGNLIVANMLDDHTRERLDTLAPGTYCGDTFTVRRFGEGDQSRVHILYDNHKDSRDMRAMFYQKYRTLRELIDAIHTDMAVKGIAPVVEARPVPPRSVFEEEPGDEQQAAA